MKIAEVVCTFPPYKGGIGGVALDNFKTLEAGGKGVTVFTPFYNSGAKSPRWGFSPRINIKRLFPVLKYGNAAFLPQLFWRLKRFDIVHLHYPFFGSAEVIWFLKKFTKAKFKLIITYHMDAVADGWLGRIFKMHNKYLMPRILKSADKIIVSSFDYADNSNIKNFKKKISGKIYRTALWRRFRPFFPKRKAPRIAG